MPQGERFTVQRVYNNNVVLALDPRARSVVLTGSGIGFGAQRGTVVPSSKIEARYVPELGTESSAASLLAGIDPKVLATAHSIVMLEGNEQRQQSRDSLLLPIADHLQYAIKRAQNQQELDFPLAWEVKTYYPKEYRLGQETLELVRRELGVTLQAAEATAFALHFLSANFAESGIDSTFRLTEVIDAVFETLETLIGTPIERGSDASARFVTHLRFLLARLQSGTSSHELPSEVVNSLNTSIPVQFDHARAIASVLNERWGKMPSQNELAYIALHVHRLLSAMHENDQQF